MAAPFTADQPFKENNVINESERSVDPADDAGKLVQLEADGKISKEFNSAPEVLGQIASSFNFSDVVAYIRLTVGTTFDVFHPLVGPLGVRIDTLDTWADVNSISNGVVIKGNYLYILLEDSLAGLDEWRLYRYDLTDLSTPATQMTFSGSTVLEPTESQMKMFFNGTYFYFTHEAGNSAFEYVIARFTFSGTVLTYDSSITFSDSADAIRYVAMNNGDIFAFDNSPAETRQYNSAGVLQETFNAINNRTAANISGSLYIGNTDGSYSTRAFID